MSTNPIGVSTKSVDFVQHFAKFKTTLFGPRNFLIKVISRLKTRSNIKKKYKLDTIKFTIFISKDPVMVFGQNCIIAS